MNEQPTKNEQAAKIIEALGDTTKVSKIFSISKASVSDWKKTGIPPARMMYLKVKYQKHIRQFDLSAATALCRGASKP